MLWHSGVSINSPSGEGGGFLEYYPGASSSFVSINSPSGEGGGVSLGVVTVIATSFVSINSPSGEGGGVLEEKKWLLYL